MTFTYFEQYINIKLLCLTSQLRTLLLKFNLNQNVKICWSRKKDTKTVYDKHLKESLDLGQFYQKKKNWNMLQQKEGLVEREIEKDKRRFLTACGFGMERCCYWCWRMKAVEKHFYPHQPARHLMKMFLKYCVHQTNLYTPEHSGQLGLKILVARSQKLLKGQQCS